MEVLIKIQLCFLNIFLSIDFKDYQHQDSYTASSADSNDICHSSSFLKEKWD